MATRQLNRLTSRQIGGAKDGWHSDGGGLYLRVSDGGRRRRWVYRFRRNGKVTEMGLGAADAVTLAAARDKRKRLGERVEEGLNPLAERRKKQDQQDARKTFAEAGEAFIAREADGWSASSLRAWKRSLGVESKQIAALHVDAIVLADVKRVIQPLVDRGYKVAARRTQNRIEAVLNFSVEHGWREEDKRSAWSPIAGKRRNGDQKHYRALDWREMPALVARLRQNQVIGARTLEFVILTATRLSEARQASWSEINFDKATWSIPASRMKNRAPHEVPLSDRALAHLTELKAHRTSSQFIFPGHTERSEPISSMAVWSLCDRVTEGKASPHGFRSSFRDWCGDTGVPRELAEMALAHSVGSKVEAAYARSSLLERRRPVMQAWADFLAGKAAEAGKVVSFE
jgi:integrase